MLKRFLNQMYTYWISLVALSEIQPPDLHDSIHVQFGDFSISEEAFGNVAQ